MLPKLGGAVRGTASGCPLRSAVSSVASQDRQLYSCPWDGMEAIPVHRIPWAGSPARGHTGGSGKGTKATQLTLSLLVISRALPPPKCLPSSFGVCPRPAWQSPVALLLYLLCWACCTCHQRPRTLGAPQGPVRRCLRSSSRSRKGSPSLSSPRPPHYLSP
jgi:hypothetical protein